MVIGSGHGNDNVLQLAQLLLAETDGLPGLARATTHELRQVKGIGEVKAAQIKAALELGRRATKSPLVERPIIRSPAEAANLHRLAENWGDKYAIAAKSWEKNWDDLTTFFNYPADIRRIIYTTNTVEAYHRQLRKVTKTKSSFPTPEAARKLLYLATVDITRKWTMPIRNWPQVLNQLVICFEDRIDF